MCHPLVGGLKLSWSVLDILILFFWNKNFWSQGTGLLLCRMSQLRPSFSCRTDRFTFDFRIPWYTEVWSIQWLQGSHVLFLQNKSSPLYTACKIGRRCLCWYVEFGFCQKWCWSGQTSLLWSYLSKAHLSILKNLEMQFLGSCFLNFFLFIFIVLFFIVIYLIYI